MSIEINDPVHALTNKLEHLQQTTQLLELEKQEYLKEIQKLKYSNHELAEKLKDLEFLTNESQQQSTVLTSVFSNHASDLYEENNLNETLQRKLKGKNKTISALTKENSIILETNKRLQVELESMNQKYIRLQLDRNAQIEEYQTKIIELQNIIDTLQNNRSAFGSNSQRRILSLDLDEEKSAPHNTGRLAGLQRERTMELNLTRIMTPDTPRAHSLRSPTLRTPMTPSRSPKFFTSKSAAHNIEIPAAVAYRNRHYKGGSTMRVNYGMHAIQQSESFTDSVIHLGHEEYTQYEEDESEISSHRSNSSDTIATTLTESEGSDATAIVKEDDSKEVEQLNTLITKQRENYKMMNDANEMLKKQLTEKDAAIEEYKVKRRTFMEQYKKQKMQMMEEWIKEKSGLIELYTDQQKQMHRKHDDEIAKMKKEIKKGKEREVKLKQEVTQMKVYNKDKELADDPPTSASCYSVKDWFKF